MFKSIINDIPQFSGIPESQIKVETLSGLSNKNYLLSTPKNHYVLRLTRKATNTFINRDNEAHNTKIAQQLGVAPKNCWREKSPSKEYTGVSLTTYISNSRTLTTDDVNNSETLNNVAKTLTTLHNSKKVFKGKLDNQKIAKHLSLYFDLCSKQQQQSLQSNYQSSLKLLDEIKNDRPAVPSHIDMVKENILLQDKKVWLIDWEYSAMASPFWDIAMFCNSADFGANKTQQFLMMVLSDHKENDFACLKQYQLIAKTISDCWQAAFNDICS